MHVHSKISKQYMHEACGPALQIVCSILVDFLGCFRGLGRKFSELVDGMSDGRASMATITGITKTVKDVGNESVLRGKQEWLKSGQCDWLDMEL